MPKKKSFKKRSKKAVTRQPIASSPVHTPTQEVYDFKSAEIETNKSNGVVAESAMAYVAHDVKRISMIVGGFLIFQLILAYLLNYTAIGPLVYGLIKV